jgi:hypothetical protein
VNHVFGPSWFKSESVGFAPSPFKNKNLVVDYREAGVGVDIDRTYQKILEAVAAFMK